MKAYCLNCNKENEYRIEEYKYEVEFEGKKICYNGKRAICLCCGNEVFLDEIDLYNQAQFENAYKIENNIITKEEINEIINKYRIGKRPLSILLGFGELTITRYLDNYVPTPKNSNYLKKILNNPEEYYNVLIDNKDKISPVAYSKSKNALESLLGFQSNDILLEDVAEYIIENNSETTPLVLQKLLYYVDLFFAVFYNKKLFESPCSKWAHGPVYGKIYYEYKSYCSMPIEKHYEIKALDDSIKEVVDEVIKNFGCYSGKVLAYFTHHEDPFNKTSDNSNISNDLIIEYANNIKKAYDIKNIGDMSKYSILKFEEYRSIK